MNNTLKDKHTMSVIYTVIQGDHSPDTLIFPDISPTIPRQCAALMPMLSGTHSTPVVLVFMQMIRLSSSQLSHNDYEA